MLTTMMRKIPLITKSLLIVNIVMFLITMLVGGTSYGNEVAYRLNDIFGLHFILSRDFHLYQLFTYMFMHGNLTHLFFNMFALWMFGCVVENVWGPRKFLFYYIACGIGAGLFQELAQFVQFYMMASEQIPNFSFTQITTVAHNSAAVLSQWTTVGASGAIYAILLAFGMIFPEERIFIFPLPIPIKAKWFVIGYAAIELFSAISTTGDGVAHIAHLGGMVFGFFMIRYWNRHPDSRYGRDGGQEFFNRLRSSWEKRSHKSTTKDNWRSNSKPTSNPDWDYNARKKAEQDEIDAILDKIRKSGYDSLTKAEKQRLFDSSRK